MYCNGQGVKRDYSTAMKWFRKASEAGNANAMFNIAAMYRNGLGIAKDRSTALEWYQKASDAGHASAKIHIRVLKQGSLAVEQTVDIAGRAPVRQLRYTQSILPINTCRSVIAYHSPQTYHPGDEDDGNGEDDSSDEDYRNDAAVAPFGDRFGHFGHVDFTKVRQLSRQYVTYHFFCDFFCDVPGCDYHSARSDPVKWHRDTHYLDYKSYICSYCQSSSARHDLIREHCLKQHQDDSDSAFRFDTAVPKPEGWIAYEPRRGPWPPVLV